MWPLTRWPPKAIGQAQGRLKIDGRAAAGPLPQGGAGQGLGADIGFKAVLQQLSRRQAHPINGNAVAHSQALGRPLLRRPADAHRIRQRLQPANGLDQSGEH